MLSPVADLIACVWQDHLDATSEDEPDDHRWRVLRNAYHSSKLPSLGVPLRDVEAYGAEINRSGQSQSPAGASQA